MDDGGAEWRTSSGGYGGRHRRLGHFGRFERSANASAGLFAQSPMRVACKDGVLQHRDRQLGQFKEQLEGLVSDAVFRVIQVRPRASKVIRSPRFGSCANKSRICRWRA
jgi:hypothetical protein